MSVRGLHPDIMILTGQGVGIPFVFFFIFFFIFFSFDCDFLSFEQPLQDPASGWKGGVNDFLFLLPSLPRSELCCTHHLAGRGKGEGWF